MIMVVVMITLFIDNNGNTNTTSNNNTPTHTYTKANKLRGYTKRITQLSDKKTNNKFRGYTKQATPNTPDLYVKPTRSGVTRSSASLWYTYYQTSNGSYDHRYGKETTSQGKENTSNGNDLKRNVPQTELPQTASTDYYRQSQWIAQLQKGPHRETPRPEV